MCAEYDIIFQSHYYYYIINLRRVAAFTAANIESIFKCINNIYYSPLENELIRTENPQICISQGWI